MRDLSVNLFDLLDLVQCASDYGFADDVFEDAMASWAGDVTDEEISAFADKYVTPEFRARGFSEEDVEDAIEVLTEWRDRYVTPWVKHRAESE